MTNIADELIKKATQHTSEMYSSRAMAFSIKGLYYYNLENNLPATKKLIEILSDRLAAMYEHESENNWNWFESYLTYANSILSEAMLFAWLSVKKHNYLDIAKKSFEFLLSQTFDKKEIKVISNKSWLSKGGDREHYGEQPIDVSYTVMALHAFYCVFKDDDYLNKLKIAFNWFLGNNHLNQIIYNPCTGGCYDGLEEYQVNLNQGAESTISYLMARLTVEKYKKPVKTARGQALVYIGKKLKKEEEMNQLAINNSAALNPTSFITNLFGITNIESNL